MMSKTSSSDSGPRAATNSMQAMPHQTTVVMCQAKRSVPRVKAVPPEQRWQLLTPEQADEQVPLAQVRVGEAGEEDEDRCDKEHVRPDVGRERGAPGAKRFGSDLLGRGARDDA